MSEEWPMSTAYETVRTNPPTIGVTEYGSPTINGRDIWELPNQLAGHVDEGTPTRLADFLIREANAAEDLAIAYQELLIENAMLKEKLNG